MENPTNADLSSQIATLADMMATRFNALEEKAATKDDLHAVEERLDARIDGIENKIGGIENRIGGIEAKMVTKVDLQEGLQTLRGEMNARFDRLETAHGARLDALERDVEVLKT